MSVVHDLEACRGCIMQQDSDPKHTSNLTTDWFDIVLILTQLMYCDMPRRKLFNQTFLEMLMSRHFFVGGLVQTSF